MTRLTEAKNPVKSVENTIELLEALKETNGAGISELSERLGLTKSSVHNYLSTLRQEDLVVKRGNEYHVGIRFLEFGGFARRNYPIYEAAKEEVEKLAAETGELVNLLVEEHGRGVYIYRDRGEVAVKVDAYTGHRVHLHNTALGKAILAYLPREYVDEIIEHYGLPRTTENTVTDRSELFEELERIRDREIAFDYEERLKGMRCVAAPILNRNDEVEGAISVSGPSRRVDEEWMENELAEKLKKSALIIEFNSSY